MWSANEIATGVVYYRLRRHDFVIIELLNSESQQKPILGRLAAETGLSIS